MTQKARYSQAQFSQDVACNIQKHIHVLNQPIAHYLTAEEKAGMRHDLCRLFKMQKSAS